MHRYPAVEKSPFCGTILPMTRKTLHRILRIVIVCLVGAALFLVIPFLIAWQYSRTRLVTAQNARPAAVAMVFGAGLQYDGTPSPILRDRVTTAVRLYQAGKVQKLLMSGDNRFLDYNEPGAMRDYAIGLGMPEADIVLDYAGRRTYDTCYRARDIFGVRQAILVTQSYHMPRALITCNALGVDAIGVPADLRSYARWTYAFWVFRELPATAVALWQVWVSHPLPVLGQPEPILFSQRGSHGS